MARLLKHTWVPLALVAMSVVLVFRFNEPLAWFGLGFNTGIALFAAGFVLSRYGRLRFPD